MMINSCGLLMRDLSAAMSRCLRSIHAATLLGLLLAINGPVVAAENTEVERPPMRWWAGVQLGTVALLDRPQAMESSGLGRKPLALQGGVRLNPEWMLGVLLDSGSFGSLPCPLAEFGCNHRKLEFDEQYLTVIFNPRRGPWLFELAVGKANSDVTERFFSGSSDYIVAEAEGSGLLVGVGYDWHRPGARTHLGWRASLEHANPGKLDHGLGSTAFTALNLSLSVSWY